MFWRTRVVIRSVRQSGARATWIALRAWRHGAVQRVAELAALIRLMSQRELNAVIEIGTQNGGTYWTWCRLATDAASVVSIDIAGDDDRRSRLRSYARPRQSQKLIRADSHDPRTARMVDELRDSVDLLFIDGDHRYDGVRADFENYAPLVRRGGLIAFHDIVPNQVPGCEVDRLWTELRELYATREIIDPGTDKQSGRYGIGVLFWHGDEDLAKWSSAHGSVPASPSGVRPLSGG